MPGTGGPASDGGAAAAHESSSAAAENMVITPEQWEARLAKANVSQAQLNKLVMNYLVVEGYKDAAAVFEEESGEHPNTPLESVASRMKVRQALQQGDVTKAMEMTNDLDPETLDTKPVLYFRLQLQKLIELIRNDKVSEALDFAEEELAPLTTRDPSLLAELEETMALLAFPDKQSSPFGHLLNAAQRSKVASELNAAILASQSQTTTPRLPSLLKLLVWSQQQLSMRCDFPTIDPLAEPTSPQPRSASPASPHDHED